MEQKLPTVEEMYAAKIDEDKFNLWMAKHFWKQSLQYIGYGGMGKQVRDILHVDDLVNLIDLQIHQIEKFNGKVHQRMDYLEKSSESLCRDTAMYSRAVKHVSQNTNAAHRAVEDISEYDNTARLSKARYDEARERFNEVRGRIEQALSGAVASGVNGTHQLSQVVRRTVGSWVGSEHRRRPMIIPVVIEV